MGRSADPIWSEIVLEELDAFSAAMRFEAARACGELQLKEAVGRLIRLTQDPDREVQEMAIWSLGQIGGRRAKEALEQWLRSDDEELSAAAEEALGELEFGQMPLDLFVHDPGSADYGEVEMLTDDEEYDADDDADLDDDEAEDWPEDFVDIG